MEQFIMKTKVYMGKSALDHLGEIPMERVLVICDPFIKESGMIDLVTKHLGRQVVCEVFSEVIPDPDVSVVTKGIGRMAACVPDTLIALGGGSALDTAKAIRYIVEQGDEKKHCRLIAIPTTSGTGSEVTSFAVISDPDKNVKYPLRDDAMVPDIAMLDPILTETVPPSITADTGMDVLTHALEAYVSVRACDFGDAFAEKAIKLVFDYLPTAVGQGDDKFARERIHNASCMAGVAFNSTSLGLCHGMAHALGARFHIAHGRSNALLLPHIIAYNASAAEERYHELAGMLGIAGATPKASALGLARKVSRLQEQIGIPNTVTALGISREEFIEAIPEMAKTALEDPCTQTNPKSPELEEIQRIFLKLV